jgi:hypothetical protein
MGIPATCSVTSCNREPSESDVVHDHIRLRQHQIASVARIVVAFGARHVQHLGTTEGGETMGGSSCRVELSPSRRSSEMISDGRSDTNREVLMERVSEHLLPTAQPWGRRLMCSPVATPRTRTSHTHLFCDLGPVQALVAKFHDLIGGGGMCGRA